MRLSRLSSWQWLATVGVWLCVGAASPALAQKVRLDTSMGPVVIELDAAKSPKTVANFLAYVNAGHYDGTVFHRVIPGFMVQGGGMNAELQERPTKPPIALESRNGLVNARGTVAMARTAVPDSATAQFFVNLKDNSFLDSAKSPDGNGYAVFGKVVSGMEVIDSIAAVPTGNKAQYQNVPVTPVVIRKASVEK